LITGDVKRFLNTHSGFGTHFMELTNGETEVSGESSVEEEEYGTVEGEDLRFVPPMQSFFVKLKAGALAEEIIELNFNPEKVTTALTAKKYQLRSLTDAGNRLRLQAEFTAANETRTSLSAIVKAVSGASNEFRASEDAQKLISKEAWIELYTLAGIVPSDINTLNADSLSGVIVPIGIRTLIAGKVTLNIKGATGFTAADNIWLVDSQEGTRTSLLERESFEFDLPKGTVENRFFLYFDQSPREIPDGTTNVTGTGTLSDAIYVSAVGNMLSVLSKVDPVEEVTIYDLTGRIVYRAVELNANYFSHRLPNVQEVYMVKVVTVAQTVTKKVIIK